MQANFSLLRPEIISGGDIVISYMLITFSISVPSAPYILSERVYTNIFDLDFDTPCEPNGRITGFKIEYRERAGSKTTSIEYGSNIRRIRISNLKPNTGYFLELSAKNTMGFGEKVAIDFYTKGTPSKCWLAKTF